MKLWTHHPSNFRIDDVTARIDATKGVYWKNNTLKYREALRRLQERLGTDQFLWCCTVRGLFVRTAEDIDLVEWELDVPLSEVLGFYSSPAWEEVIQGQEEAWDRLFLDRLSKEAGTASKEVDAWVRFPLKSGTAKCLGPLPVQRRR